MAVAAVRSDPATGANAASNAVPPQAVSETNDEAETAPGDSDKGTTPYFELTPWRGDWEFYYAAAGEVGTYPRSWYQRIEWNNVVGVLLTVLLLSLGAPFWFDMLKQVVNLKDTLERSTGREGEQDSEQTETEPTPSVTNDRINLLKERMLAAKSPVVKATLQKEINDLRLIRAEQA